MDFTQVMNTFLNIPGVVRVHNLRIWALSMEKTAISAHLAICKYV
jgi:Co/Zn/Cd efflux system component